MTKTAPKTSTKTATKTDVIASTPIIVPCLAVVAPVAVAPVAVEEVVFDEVMIKQSTDFLTKLQQISAMISTLKTEYRVLEKKWTKELKIAHKLSSKRKRKAGNRAPSGFVKPTGISDELAKFL